LHFYCSSQFIRKSSDDCYHKNSIIINQLFSYANLFLKIQFLIYFFHISFGATGPIFLIFLPVVFPFLFTAGYKPRHAAKTAYLETTLTAIYFFVCHPTAGENPVHEFQNITQNHKDRWHNDECQNTGKQQAKS